MNLEIKIAADGSRTYYVEGVETTEAEALATRDELSANEPATLQALIPLPVEGSTIEEVKASAEAAIADLAVQVNARLAQITEPQL